MYIKSCIRTHIRMRCSYVSLSGSAGDCTVHVKPCDRSPLQCPGMSGPVQTAPLNAEITLHTCRYMYLISVMDGYYYLAY